ncbi:MAG: hypothetical protein R3A52_18050 [Polyangiales bacterium]
MANSAELQLASPPAMATAAGIVHRAVLVGGRSYASATAVPAFGAAGHLGNVTAVADLRGRGSTGLSGQHRRAPYALDACTLASAGPTTFTTPWARPWWAT